MGEETQETTEVVVEPQEASVTPEVTETQEPAANPYDYVLDKYKAEGRSDQEAAEEQAKAYGDLEKKFGGFTGTPKEGYVVEASEELQALGVNVDQENPMLQNFLEIAKENNMSQDMFNSVLNNYLEGEVAQAKAQEEYIQKELESLPNYQGRTADILKYASANYDDATVEGLHSMVKSAADIKTMESIIQQNRNAPVAVDTAVAPKTGEIEIKEMQFAKDQYGGRRIDTDPAFKAKYIAARDDFYGLQPHKEIIGQ